MRYLAWLALAFVVATAVAPGEAHAQPTRGRGNVSLAVFNVDFVRTTQEEDGVETILKDVGFGYPQLRFGGAYGVHDLLMLGAETGLSWHSIRVEGAGKVNVTTFSLTPTLDVFLTGGGDRTRERGARPFLGAAVGFAYEGIDNSGGPALRSPQGVFLARLGVRGFISRTVSVDPLAVIGGRVGTLRGDADGKSKVLVFRAGFTLTFWMGDPEPLPF